MQKKKSPLLPLPLENVPMTKVVRHTDGRIEGRANVNNNSTSLESARKVCMFCT